MREMIEKQQKRDTNTNFTNHNYVWDLINKFSQ